MAAWLINQSINQSIIIWLDRATEKPCARLLASRKNWMTATRDDIVMLTTDQQSWQNKFITQIKRCRVFRAERNSEIVESAQAWIDAAGEAK